MLDLIIGIMESTKLLQVVNQYNKTVCQFNNFIEKLNRYANEISVSTSCCK